VPVEVVPYSSSWPEQFELIARELRRALATLSSARVEHVGSTSVPGLAAKPVLDIDVIVDGVEMQATVAAMGSIGYVHRGDLGVADREAFHAPDQSPRRNVYVCRAGTLSVRNHLAVRDVLRRRTDLRDEYAAVKLALAAEPDMDIDTYIAGKSAVLQKVLGESDLSEEERRQILLLNDPSAGDKGLSLRGNEGKLRSMELVAEPLNRYLGGDGIVQTDDPEVIALGAVLRSGRPDDVEFVRAAFEWVRDTVAHASDVGDARVTLSATAVLHDNVGLCYAKSHLLAAVLRSQGIPTGLCYQRLADETDGHVIHGLVAVHLNDTWHRQDPRGNKPGIDAQFSLDSERLAYVVDERRGEKDYQRLYVSAADEVVAALRAADNVLTCQLPTDLE